MERLKEVLAIVNNKGGVAKTTTAQSVAAGILRNDKKARVLCIDLDPQGNLSTLLGWNQENKLHAQPLTVVDALRNGSALPVYKHKDRWFYVPSCHDLTFIDTSFAQQMQPNKVLCECMGNEVLNLTDEILGYIEDDFDYIIIDCGPDLSRITNNAMSAATGIIIPVQLEGLSVLGIGEIVKTYRQVKSQLNPDLTIRGLLFCMADERIKLTKNLEQNLRENYEGMVFQTRIRACADMKNAQMHMKDIFEYKPYSNVGIDYDRFVIELLHK